MNYILNALYRLLELESLYSPSNALRDYGCGKEFCGKELSEHISSWG